MPAYVSANVIVKDQAKLGTYLSELPATLKPFGGKLICRGKVAKALLGEPQFQLMATFEFADVETADAWYQSAAYQALIPNRDEAAEGTIVILQGQSL